MMASNIFDIIIIGTGPAGLTASIYASRYRLSNLLLGKKMGGTIGLAHKVENYPGFPSITGLDLMTKIEEHVKGLGGEIIYDPAQKIVKGKDELFTVYTASGRQYESRAVILATGTERRILGIPGEKEYLGKGVSYCTTCDAPFYKDKVVVLVGGSDGAVSGAVHSAQYAKKVYLVYRKENLRATPAWIQEWEKLVKEGKGESIFNTNIKEIKNDDKKVIGVVLDNPYKGSQEIKADGVFIEIGGVPGTSIAQEMGVETDENGFIKTSKWMETNIKGVFASGDCTCFLYGFAQMVTAASMGALAARSAYVYIKQEAAPQLKGN